ncbi:three prime repair exonuclease 2-like [Mixophyes fleayi]|uniref:three prime repair exonuclease 2-like n=1 Tax=Mixophyes fleayi TaxID=3061075 RepID=UPI003F4D8475
MGGLARTFIFLDLEATGLNADDPKITELALVAVHVSSLENPVRDASGEPQLPRVLDKLCLCVDPGKPLTQVASEITHLTNEQLSGSEKQKFDSTLINTINEFVNRQAQPVCLVAHNGFGYDFPLLKTELLQHQRDLPSSMLCLDSLQSIKFVDNQSCPKPVYVKGRYSLPELYRSYFGKEPNFSHYAEGDVLTLILVFMYRAGELLEADNNKRWGEIRPMYM